LLEPIPTLEKRNPGRPFFCTLPANVPLFKDGNGDWCIDTAQTELGRAVTCFLSPLDAITEATHLARNGPSYRVMTASDIEENLFCDRDGEGLIADIHVEWPARDRRILTRPSGAFGRSSTVMHRWAEYPPPFEVDGLMLAEYSRYRELAGLYAWQETAANILCWPEARRDVLARRALASIELTHGGPKDCEQIALYDREFEQWHFVPYAEHSNTGVE
jgi:hypothetical protein